MKKIGIVLLVVALTLALGLVPMASVSAAGKGGATEFVTGGGSIKDADGAVILTFGGNVGFVEGVGIVGQFQIVDHVNNISWHCNNDFTSLVFSGPAIVGPPGPSASHNTATFTGTFTNNRNAPTLVVTVEITDLGEPGAGHDTIEFVSAHGDSGPLTIDGGNFQMHKGTSSNGDVY